MNPCPLFLRASFVGHTYHDFLMKFQSSSINCSANATQNLFLIEFTRLINSTINSSSYILYDRSKPIEEHPHVQVYPNEHAQLCIRSAVETNPNVYESCHEFYMVTMLSSVNQTIWPLLIVFAYLFVLIIGMIVTTERPWKKTIVESNFTQRIINNRNFRLFLHGRRRKARANKINEKLEFLRTIDSIARDCRTNPNTFIIEQGEMNLAFF